MSQLMSHDSKDLIQYLAKMSREGGARQSMPRKRKTEPLPQRSTFQKGVSIHSEYTQEQRDTKF
jgi:hypothetical protein